MSLDTSEHQCSKRMKECKVTNEQLTERVKTVDARNDGVCVCEKRMMNMFADLGLIYLLGTLRDTYEPVISRHLAQVSPDTFPFHEYHILRIRRVPRQSLTPCLDE